MCLVGLSPLNNPVHYFEASARVIMDLKNSVLA